MPNGAKKPVAVQVLAIILDQVIAVYLPMKSQYLTKKNLVRGLNGMLLLGPSG